jgi:hypothetical protein
MNKLLILICGLVAFAALFRVTQAATDHAFRVTTISSRPDMISGGDVLVQIDAPLNFPLEKTVLKLNGQDVSAALHADPKAHTLIGLITGLKLGENSLEVFNGQTRVSQLSLKDYPVTGPIFSGSQEQPFFCQTQDFILPDGTSLGPPLDSNCSAKTVVTYMYKSTSAAVSAPKATGSAEPVLKPMSSLTALPSDVAWTTTSTGEKVPYVVRIETGTVNRSIYQIAMLHDPTQEPQPNPFSPPKGWNKRLLYSFGGGCNGGWLKQGTSIGYDGGMVKEAIVAKGYAEASATLNVFGNNCNSVIAAETMMMVKERFIKAYGQPDFTISWGASGGSEQQLPIADNYPGLLDGIIPGRTFPDLLTNIQSLADSQLLYHYFVTAGQALSGEQKLAIEGSGRVKDFSDEINRFKPAALCPSQLPAAQRYDAAANRSGVRCDVFDHAANVLGRDPATGFARRPMDNTGVQYGLAALNARAIGTAQFLDLNQNIGGYDEDGNFVAARNTADPQALRAAYQRGQITTGGLGLAQHPVPIIDVRPYRDLLPDGDIHLKFHSFSLRARLLKANGTFANDVLLVGPVSRSIAMDEYAVSKMDEWLTALGKTRPGERTVEEIVRAKPADLEDSCYTEAGDRIVERQAPTGGECNKLYPMYPSPRMIAGEPASNDVLKCQLKPIDFKDYRVTFTEAEKKRLTAVFPEGVCDWTKAGVGQQTPTGTWLSY